MGPRSDCEGSQAFLQRSVNCGNLSHMPLALMLLAVVHSSKPTTIKTLTVFAAASLKDAMATIKTGFEGQERCKVRYSFGGSQALAAQINAGAPADVLASADEATLDKVKFDGATRVVFASNSLAVVVPNTSSLHSFEDLSRASKIVIAAPQVPAGRYTRRMLDLASKAYGQSWTNKVLDHVRSEEQDVRTVLTKVQLGEAEAGVVYLSDAYMAGKSVKVLKVPAKLNVIAKYPAAVIAGAPEPQLAVKFVRYLGSAAGKKALKSSGFVPAGSASKPK